MSFVLSANDEILDQQSFIYAAGPDGIIQDNLPHKSGQARVSGSITRQISDRNTFSIRPNYQYETDENRGVGGTTLASAASTFTHHEQQVTYTQQTILRPTLLNQFQVLVGHERELTSALPTPASSSTARSGGWRTGRSAAHRDAHQPEREPGVTKGHLIQAGFSCPTGAARVLRTNFARSPSRSQRYTRPLRASRSSRATATSFLESGRHLLKDDCRCSLAYRARSPLRLAELLSRHQQRAPRFGRLGAGNKKTNVCAPASASSTTAAVRWSSPTPTRAWRLDQIRRHRSAIVIRSPRPRRVRRCRASCASPDARFRRRCKYSVGLDHQLQKTLTLSITYTGARGYHMFRSRDVKRRRRRSI